MNLVLELLLRYGIHIALVIFVLVIVSLSIMYRNRPFGPASGLTKHNTYILDGGLKVFVISLQNDRRDSGNLFDLMSRHKLRFIDIHEFTTLSKRSDLPKTLTVITILCNSAFRFEVIGKHPYNIELVNNTFVAQALRDRFTRLAVSEECAAPSRDLDESEVPQSTIA